MNNPDLVSTTTLVMRQAATSMNTVAFCNPFTTDSSGDSVSVTRRPHSSSCASASNHGPQTAASLPRPQPIVPKSFRQNPDPCNCLTAPIAFGPLLHLGISLRTSREALEHLHPLSSDCMLYCRISMLEKHILYVHAFNSELSC